MFILTATRCNDVATLEEIVAHYSWELTDFFFAIVDLSEAYDKIYKDHVRNKLGATCLIKKIITLSEIMCEKLVCISYAQIEFTRGCGDDCGKHGRFRADRGRLGRGRKYWPVIGADWGPIDFDRNFGGVTPPLCGALGHGKMSVGIRRRSRSALR